jgi:tetratricopeptide (TPR) repeat protein
MSFARRPPRAAFGLLVVRVVGVEKGWRSVRLDEIEPIPVVNGTLRWRPVRRTLDVGAFGINAYIAPNAGDDVVEEHTERALGHEEVYVVLAGRATFTLDGETLDAPAGTAVFVHDPEVKRYARAEEPGTQVLAVGGPRGAAYEPSPWEDYFAAERHRNAGDYDAYADELVAALERRPDHPATLYNLACAEALAGRADEALAHLKRAVELRPEAAEWAKKDEDFASLHERAEWRSLIDPNPVPG